jgi:hypothetical protein
MPGVAMLFSRLWIVLNRYGNNVVSVFDLFGHGEVHLTAALGWVLEKSPPLLEALLRQFGLDVPAGGTVIALEQVDEYGRTDIELTGPALKVVVEAKQGWLVPGDEQLTKYLPRFENFRGSRLLVSMSDSSERWATDQLPSHLAEIPVRHVSWDAVRDAVRSTLAGTRGRERVWLEELETYMGRATSMVAYDDQWVFCVVVSDSDFGGKSFRDYVLHDRVYFHPFGGNNTWPKVAPNFLCFRWGGRVRQVNRVRRFEVVPRLADRWPSVTPAEEEGPHIVYDLGPDIPIPAISTKGTYASGRVWCLLDQLLVSPTLAAAVRSSKDLGE